MVHTHTARQSYMSNNNNVNKSANSINIKQQKSNFESLQFSRAPKCFQYFNTFQNAATPFEEEIDLPSAKSKEITQRWEAHMHYFHHCLTCETRSGLFATDCLVEGLPKVHSRLVDRGRVWQDSFAFCSCTGQCF